MFVTSTFCPTRMSHFMSLKHRRTVEETLRHGIPKSRHPPDCKVHSNNLCRAHSIRPFQIFHEFTHKAYIHVQMHPPNASVHDRIGLASAPTRLNPPTLLSQKDTPATLFPITDFRINRPQCIPDSMVLRLFILYRSPQSRSCGVDSRCSFQ